MKQVMLSGKGEIVVLNVPAPARLPGSVLVRTTHSLISQGTEGSAVSSRGGWLGVYEKVTNSRDRVGQVWSMFRQSGLQATRQVVMSKLEDMVPLGYSSAGVVVEVSDGALDFRPGDKVACMGAGFAVHGEFAVVPVNLCAKLPEGVPSEVACFGAVACIAMQGIRRLEAGAGETIVILGLGLVGQLAVQIGTALGYRVLGIDLSEEKADLARLRGALDAWSLTSTDSAERVRAWTDGAGADGVVVCAGTKSDDPLNLAFDLCRPRGSVSIVGDVGLGADRGRMFKKELDMRMSTSYGPGRYDPGYELDGRDYPVGHVRWTQGRNLRSFLDLAQRDLLDIPALISRIYPPEDAIGAYRSIKEEPGLLGVLFAYSAQEVPGGPARTVQNRAPAVRSTKGPPLRLALIGAGGFTKAVHVPNLLDLKTLFALEGVASRSGATAGALAHRVGARLVTSDYRSILDDVGIDAVLIATRHATHGRIAIEALEAGKHVFVEKPLAISEDDCQKIVDLQGSTGLTVRVGFNRRFAPLYQRLQGQLGAGPHNIFYRVNVGSLGTHWSTSSEEGGRLLGEGSHFFDLFTWLTGAHPTTVAAGISGPQVAENPDTSTVIRYSDGSLCTLLYTTSGHKDQGKELLEVHSEGNSFRVDSFGELQAWGARGTKRGAGDKGHRGILEEFAHAVLDGTDGGGADAAAGQVATVVALSAHRAALNQSVVLSPPP